MIYSFLKSSSVLDFIFIFLVLGSAFILVIGGVWMVIAAKRRTPVYVFLAVCLIPLLIAVAGGGFRCYRDEKLLGDYAVSMSEDTKSHYRSEFRTNLLIMSALGLAGTGLPAMLGLAALVRKKHRRST